MTVAAPPTGAQIGNPVAWSAVRASPPRAQLPVCSALVPGPSCAQSSASGAAVAASAGPAPTSTPGAAASGAVVPTGAARAHQPIASLNPYSNKWTIKARVTSKGDIRTWSNAKGEGKLFGIELLDEYASEIRATFFRDAVDKFFPLLQEGQVYYFGNGKLKRANRRYTSVNNDYEITFDDRAVIEPAEDAGKIAQHHFEFVPIAKLADMPANSTVDVLGYVQEVQEVVSITTKAGKEVDKRDLTLVDSSSASITLTLWGEKARQPSETFTNAIIALKGCKLGDYSGRSLSTYASSTVLINEGIPEEAPLRQWAEAGGARADVTALSVRGGAGVSASTSLESRKPISAIQDEGLGAGDRGDFITVKAHITFVSHKVERPPWYPANPDADETGRKTYKKLTDAGDGTWIDERTGKRHSEPEWRYVLNVGLGDETGTVYATCFNETAEVLLGKSATEMHAMYAASIPPGGAVEGAEIADPAWNSTFDKPLFTQWLFTLKVKVERVNDEERTRTSVVRMTPINYASECQSLHEAIAKFV